MGIENANKNLHLHMKPIGNQIYQSHNNNNNNIKLNKYI